MKYQSYIDIRAKFLHSQGLRPNQANQGKASASSGVLLGFIETMSDGNKITHIIDVLVTPLEKAWNAPS
jgi:hypothetical protein